MNWEINGEEHSHGVSVKSGDVKANIKWDGCVEIYNYQPDKQHIHICDIDRFVEMLKSLEGFRVDYFEKQGTLL